MDAKYLLLIVAVAIPLICSAEELKERKRQHKCEPITISMCRSMPYNMTRMPERMSQNNVRPLLERFQPLLSTRCSKYLRFFMCSRFVPICTLDFVHPATIPPCRNICEAARSGCEPLLLRFNVSWPREFDCSELPLYEKSVCVTPEAIVSEGMKPESSKPGKQGAIEVGNTGKCQCLKVPRLCRKLYLQGKYHYAIKAEIKSVEVIGELTLTNVTIHEVMKQTNVPLKKNTDVLLWTNSSCPCPGLTVGKKYLIIGYEDVANGRLLYLFGSVGTRWRNVYIKRISDWDAKLKKILKKRVEKQKSRAERRKRKKERRQRSKGRRKNVRKSRVHRRRRLGRRHWFL